MAADDSEALICWHEALAQISGDERRHLAQLLQPCPCVSLALAVSDDDLFTARLLQCVRLEVEILVLHRDPGIADPHNRPFG